MCEIRRVLLSRKYILLVVIMLISNMAVFQYYQIDTLSKLKSEDTFTMFVIELENKQEEEHKEFYDKLSNISIEKEKMLNISIFSDEGSFAYKNIVKTEQDYNRIMEVTLSDINDYAVDAFLEYDVIYIFGFIIMMFTVLSFLDERKRGLWQIVHTCRNGRLKIVLNRLFILAWVAVITEIILVTSTLFVSFLDYGGADILFDSVQSVGKLQDFVLPVSLFEFLMYYILFLSGALLVSGLFVWLVLSLIHNSSFGMIMCSFAYVIQFFLNYFISSRNPLCIFKYTNLWFLINPREVFTSYNNFMFLGIMFNLREYMSVMLIVVILLLGISAVTVGIVTKPFYTPGVIEKYVGIVLDKFRKVLCHSGGMGYELFKMLVQKKGIIVIAALFYIFITNIDTTELILSPQRMLLDDFYAINTGEINENSVKAYNELEQKINIKASNGEEVSEATVQMLELLKEQKDYAENLEDRGINGWFINDRGYRLLFGELKSVKRIINGVLSIFALVLMIAPIFVSEYQSGIHYLIASTRKGKGTLFRRKMLYCLTCTCVIAVTMFAVELYEVRLKYNLKGLNAPVQNIRMLENVPLSISIGGFIVLWYILRASVMIMSSCIIMYISVYGRKQNRVYMMAVLLIPLGVINGMSEYRSGFGFVITVIVPIVLCVMVSAACLVRCYRRWSLR